MSEKLDQIYDQLKELHREVNLLVSISALVEWDQRCFMPSGGSDHRAEQTSWLAGKIHKKSTKNKIGELLSELEAAGIGKGLDPRDVNVREWRHDFDLRTKLPQEFVEDLSRTTSLAQDAWVGARKNNDFGAFQPWLEKIVALKRREADYLGWKNEPYDALLDEYEPGAKTEEVAAVLGGLRDQLVPLLKAIKDSPRKPRLDILHRDYPEAAQEAFSKRVAAAIGFDFNRGRLDVTAHPFCTTIGPNDIRITTRFIRDHVNAAFFGVMHEAGHGLYEQNVLAEHKYTPMGEAVSLGIHESQSRMWENSVGRSLAFWQYWYPEAQKAFTALKDVSVEDFTFAVNAVEPSFIRVEADETTYNLHILLRFELERALLKGDLQAKDVPAAWNEKFKAYFGLDVPDNANGCLQDIHWSAGLIGYFPTYSLGNLNAAQFFVKATEDLGDLEAMFAKGQFAPLLGWLRTNVHSHGRRYRSADLTKVVTGKPLDSKPLVDYLKKKAEMWYGVKG